MSVVIPGSCPGMTGEGKDGSQDVKPNRTKQKYHYRSIRSVQFYSAPPSRPAIAPRRSRSALSLMKP